MIKISHRNKRGGYTVRFVTSYNEAKFILEKLFKQHLPAKAYDEDYPEDIIGRVWKDDNEQWNWFCN